MSTSSPTSSYNLPLTTLGQVVTKFEGFDRILVDKSLSRLTFDIADVTSVCPVTGQPDFETVSIILEPDGFSVETKTLKLYLETFRNQGLFVEDLASTIARELFTLLTPRRIDVVITQHVRGGIVTTAQATFREGQS